MFSVIDLTCVCINFLLDESELSGSWKISFSTTRTFETKYDQLSDFVVIDEQKTNETAEDSVSESISYNLSSLGSEEEQEEENSISLHIDSEDKYVVSTSFVTE